MISRTALGIVIGLALGFVVVFASFGEMLIVALFGAIGFVIARALEGDLDLSRYSSRERRWR
jgi:hypothetical protein